MLAEDQDIFQLFDEFYLIDGTPPIQAVKEKQIIKEITNQFHFIGANKKNTLFIYDDKNKLLEKNLMMVETLIKNGIGWSVDDIALINLSENNWATFQQLKEYFNPKQVIFWGCDEFLNANKIPQKFYEVLVGKEFKVLCVKRISDYENNLDVKKLLWVSIQKLFDIK